MDVRRWRITSEQNLLNASFLKLHLVYPRSCRRNEIWDFKEIEKAGTNRAEVAREIDQSNLGMILED